jgi:hypothetical protein
MVGLIISVIVVIAVIIAYPVAGIIMGIIVAVIIFFSYQSAKNQKIKEEQYRQFVQNTLAQHPEFGNYKLFHGSEGTVLVLSEEGYCGFFKGDNQFRSGSIHDIKTIKFVAEPFDRYTKKTTRALGNVVYRLEFLTFQSPIIDLPFGVYRSVSDKAPKRADFAEYKANSDLKKKTARARELLAPIDPAKTESNTPIDLAAINKVCMEAGDKEEHDIDFWLTSDNIYETITENGPTAAWLKNNPPVRIVYTDKEGNKTVRDITPLRINGSPDWDFGINAYCHLRKDSRDFWVSKISAAWCQGEEINLGDYLAKLCKKTPEYKAAVKNKAPGDSRKEGYGHMMDKEADEALGASQAAELRRTKKLLDSGVLTQEEFDKKKMQILGL